MADRVQNILAAGFKSPESSDQITFLDRLGERLNAHTYDLPSDPLRTTAVKAVRAVEGSVEMLLEHHETVGGFDVVATRGLWPYPVIATRLNQSLVARGKPAIPVVVHLDEQSFDYRKVNGLMHLEGSQPREPGIVSFPEAAFRFLMKNDEAANRLGSEPGQGILLLQRLLKPWLVGLDAPIAASIACVSAVAASSHTVKALFHDIFPDYPRDKTFVLPNGYDPYYFKSIQRDSAANLTILNAHLPGPKKLTAKDINTDKVVVFYGDFSRMAGKNQNTPKALLDAVSQYEKIFSRTTHPVVTILVDIGDDFQRGLASAEIERLGLPHTFIAERLPQHILAGLLGIAQVGIIPADNEIYGTGRGGLELAASGTPAIFINKGIAPSIEVVPTGLRINSSVASIREELAYRIVAALTDRWKNESSARISGDVQSYRIEDEADRAYKMYNRLFSSAGGSTTPTGKLKTVLDNVRTLTIRRGPLLAALQSRAPNREEVSPVTRLVERVLQNPDKFQTQRAAKQAWESIRGVQEQFRRGR